MLVQLSVSVFYNKLQVTLNLILSFITKISTFLIQLLLQVLLHHLHLQIHHKFRFKLQIYTQWPGILLTMPMLHLSGTISLNKYLQSTLYGELVQEHATVLVILTTGWLKFLQQVHLVQLRLHTHWQEPIHYFQCLTLTV